MLELEDARPISRPAPNRGTSPRVTAVSIIAWASLVALGSLLVYRAMVSTGRSLHDATPLHATIDPRATIGIVVSLAVAMLAVRYGPRLALTLAWGSLLRVSWLSAAAWACSLAAIRGWHRLAAPLEHPGEYLAVLPRVHALGDFLGGYADNIASFPVHVQGHPPGFVMVAWTLQAIGLGGAWPLAALCVLAGAAAVPAVLVTVREVAGSEAARRCAPFLILAPAAILIATSADALFTGVGAWAVALLVLATGRRDRRADLLAVGGGVLFGVAAFLSYGLVLLAVIPLVIAGRRRRIRPILLAGAGALAVFATFLAAGFWWFDGLAATRVRYFVGIARHRPYAVYIVANLASFAVVLGPAIAPALARLRDRKLWLVVGGGLLAVALADVSGMSKGEVERIWLPFAPFVLAATAALWPCNASVRGGTNPSQVFSRQGIQLWLTVQVGFAIALEALVRTAW